MPLTAITTIIGAISMFGSWLYISARMRLNQASDTHQTRLLRNYFLFMGTFTVLMFLPYILLTNYPDKFPLAMAIGYVTGHIFLYLAMMQILRLFFSIVPRLSGLERAAIIVSVLFIVAMTAFNARTMIWGIRPGFDETYGVTLFHAHPIIAIGTAVYGFLAVLPTAVLMIKNGLTNPVNRARSFLLGSGLFLLMTTGPLHDNAKSASVYMIADFATILSLLIFTAGVAHHMEHRISLASPAPVTPQAPPSTPTAA